MVAHVRTFADFLVYEFSTSAGGQQLNKCIEILNDMVWKYNIVTLDRLILCLVRIYLLNNKFVSFSFESRCVTNESYAHLLYITSKDLMNLYYNQALLSLPGRARVFPFLYSVIKEVYIKYLLCSVCRRHKLNTAGIVLAL